MSLDRFEHENYTFFFDIEPVFDTYPLVTVITSTWKRKRLLTERCIPSVKKQTYPNIEHVVVSDGQENYEIEEVRYFQLGRNWNSVYNKVAYGVFPRLVGTYLAKGKYIAYLDDDDEYYPNHISSLVYALEESDADLAFSKMERFDGKKVVGIIGGMARPQLCHIGTPMIMHKPDLLKIANWSVPPNNYAEDGFLVENWVNSEDTKIAFVDMVTVRYHNYES